ncbi:unnamed protein product [Closterium sp. NIES-64]|nr:unnamed protein product [Closterium sp. NIES-64]
MGEPETRCVRGCCVSTTLKLNVPKAEIKTGPLIAKGPESSVYEGSYLEQPVALKKPRLSTSEDMDRFHKELKLLSSLKHPHIASLLAARAYPPDYVLIFTLHRGGNLHEALHTKQWKPSVLDILRIGYQAAQALAYVHSLGVVHRDVKPSNILIDDLGNAFLPPEALIASFLATDKALELELSKQRKARPDSGKGWYPGCTACVTLVIGTDMYIANAGDCRAVVRQSGEVKALSRDHVASDPEERSRAEKAGGLVQWRVNTWRVGAAGIEVTRSLGDHDMKPAVTAEPEVTHHRLTEEDEFLVMASDGLWEKLSNEEVSQYVLDTVKEPSMSSKRLVTEAVDRGSQDNVTAIVAYLKNVSTVERIY